MNPTLVILISNKLRVIVSPSLNWKRRLHRFHLTMQLSSDSRNLHDRIRSSNYDQSGEIPSSEFSSGTAGFNVTSSGDATSSGGILSAALRPTPISSRYRATAQTETSDNSSILTMLQQQQAVLQRVLDGQKSLEERQNKMEQSLAELQKNMEQSGQCYTADSGTDRKRKRVVTRTLSVSHIMYPSLCLSIQLNTSEHNKGVQAVIIKEILSQPNCTTSADLARGDLS